LHVREIRATRDVTVAQDVPKIQWYWVDNFGDNLYPGFQPLTILTHLEIFTRNKLTFWNWWMRSFQI